MATTNKTKAAGHATKGLKVIARADHFRRAGHAFGAEAKTLFLDGPEEDPRYITKEQADALKDERLLVCQEVDIEPPKEEAKA